jgi:hypothetical protein
MPPMMTNEDQAPSANPGTGYRVPNRVELPHPRSQPPLWQDAGGHAGLSQKMFPTPMQANRRWKRSSHGRWRDWAILLGLWLLILLAAAAIILRFVDETEPSAAQPGVRAAAVSDQPRPLPVVPNGLAATRDPLDEDDPLPEPARRYEPAPPAATPALKQAPVTTALARTAPAGARPVKSEPVAAKPTRTEQVKPAPGAESAAPQPGAQQIMPAKAGGSMPDVITSLALPASLVHPEPAPRSTGSAPAAATRKAAPVCSDALQAMQLCGTHAP